MTVYAIDADLEHAMPYARLAWRSFHILVHDATDVASS
jgi:hypothetical protein